MIHQKVNLSLSRFSILGVSSWGDCEKFPDVYARVTTAEAWIMEQAPGAQHSNCGANKEVRLKNKSGSGHVNNENLLLDLMTNNDKEPSKKLLLKKKIKL